MNLLSNTEKDFLRKGLKSRFFIVASILSAISFLIGTVALLPVYFLTREHLDSAISLKSPVKAEDEELMKNILELPDEVNSKLAFLKSYMGDKEVVGLISKIMSFLPEKVKLNSILFTKNKSDKGKKGITILLAGIALDREALVSFGVSLRKSSFFSTVDVPVSNLAKERDLPFSMNVFIEI